MKYLPSFREDRILREQVKLVFRNYAAGFIGFFFATVVATMILHMVSEPVGVNYLLMLSAVFCLIPLMRYWVIKHNNYDPRSEAKKQVAAMLCVGLVWSAYVLLYIDGESLPIMVTIIAFTTGLTAAGLAMQSACLPVYLAFAYTTIPALTISLVLLNTPFYYAVSAAVVIYLITMTAFGKNLEASIEEAIRLRFEKNDLVNQLERAIEKTNEASHAKSVFLASASHDLRQPLHAMSLFIQTLSSTPLSDYQEQLVVHIESASKASRDMLNTLLDFSKLDAGVIKVKPYSFNLQILFNTLEQELATSADSKNIVYRTRETALTAYTDRALLELILRNLITNAIRYTETGGVLIACRKRANKKLLIEVWDTGIGIPAAEQENIFKEFIQLHNPERDRQKGFGLGLAITKSLAKLLGVSLTLNSRLDRGSVFRVQIDEAETTVVEDIVDKQVLIHFDGKTVLVIDDDKTIRLAMHELLLLWGCNCLTAESAAEALAIGKEQRIDLMIVDYRLREGKTGTEAITLLREQLGQGIPAIIITGDTAADRLREAEKSGVALLHKPIESSVLQATMHKLLD